MHLLGEVVLNAFDVPLKACTFGRVASERFETFGERLPYKNVIVVPAVLVGGKIQVKAQDGDILRFERG
jgi:hypothetical protein